MFQTFNPHRTPIVDDLEIFEIEVDGDDPRWQRIEPSKHIYFPVKPGKWIVRYVLLSFSFDPTNEEVIAEIVRRNLTPPDRATTETILDARLEECPQKPIVGVCEGGYVYEDASGRVIDLDIEDGWLQYSRFVAVVSETLP